MAVRNHIRSLLVLVSMIALLVSACSSSDLSATTSPTPPATVGKGTVTPTITPVTTGTPNPLGGASCSGGGPYLAIQGAAFALSGTPVRLQGATIYPYFPFNGRTLRASAWTQPSFTHYIDQMLTLATQAKMNMVRATDFFSGTTDWRNPAVWANMDYLMCQAQAHHMFVVVSLSAYRNLLLKQPTFPYDPAQWQDFLAFVGARYANNPALAYYALAGEPAAPTGQATLKPTSDQLVAFYTATAAALHTSDQGHHIISSGGLSFLNFNSGIRWQDIFALPYIGVAAIHVYSDNDRNITFPMVSAWANQHHIPFVIEEFGFKQGMGDDARAAAYADLYQKAIAVQTTCIGFWNLGPEINANTYDVNPQTPAVWQVIQKNAP